MRPVIAAGDSARARPTVAAYLWWAATGALAGFGAVGALTIGVFLLPAAVLLLVGIGWRPLRNSSIAGALAGVALVPLFVAWLNRRGPGTVCTTLRSGLSCQEQWSPWPFAVAGVALLGAFGALVVFSRRRARAEGAPFAASSDPRLP